MGKLFITILSLLPFLSFAQNVNEPIDISGATYNIMVHKPASFNDSLSKKYPVIVLFPGTGQVGSDTAENIKYGPNNFVRSGWNGIVTLGDSTFECIIATIGRPTASTDEVYMYRTLDTIITRYRGDVNRVYLMAISLGGQQLVKGLVKPGQTGANYRKYKRPIAAILMSSAAVNNQATGYNYTSLAEWADLGGSIMDIRGVSDGVPPPFDSTLGVMNPVRSGSAIGHEWTTSDAASAGHCCWNTFSDPSWIYWGTDSLTMYKWLLGHSKYPYASAGQAVINTTETSVTLNGIVNQYPWGYNGWNRTISWTKKSGGSATIVSSSSDTTLVTGLSVGTYVFTLKSKNGGETTADVETRNLEATFDVTVNVTQEEDNSTYFIKMRGRKLIIQP